MERESDAVQGTKFAYRLFHNEPFVKKIKHWAIGEGFRLITMKNNIFNRFAFLINSFEMISAFWVAYNLSLQKDGEDSIFLEYKLKAIFVPKSKILI